MNKTSAFDMVINLAKRRGFLFPGSEIYGGLESTWDLGPMGVELSRNIKDAWWREVVTGRENVVGIDTAIFMHPKVWQASGHVAGFNDPMVECAKCNKRWRSDKLKADKCPDCGGALGPVKQFNLMFITHFGPIESEDNMVYLRPETAQGIFVNFNTVQKTMRLKLPFGIAQIGKAFRNEITTGSSLFRTREFEQMELEFFTDPKESDKWFDYWQNERLRWYVKQGIAPENIRLRPYAKAELAHYSKATTDVEYNFPFGFDEVEGIANRQSFDLDQHSKVSGKKLEYFDAETNKKVVPHVIEPSAGVGRLILMFLLEAYTEDEAPTAKGKREKRTVLKLNPRLAPVKKAVLPLVKNKPELTAKARGVFERLRQREAVVMYDEAGAIGRRYRRQDEIGTPQCVTVDFETLESDTVTVRDRDSMKQERVKISEL